VPNLRRQGLVIVATLATAYVASHFFRASNVTIGLDLMRDLAIALACDIRIAAQSAFVSTGYAKVGLSGDYGIAWLLTRAVGSARARELMFTAERVDAERCERIGLVNRIVPDDKLQAEAFEFAKSLANGPRVALRNMKDNLDDALHIDYATALHREAERLVRASRTADHKEAVQAFVEKRKPVFKGR